MALIFDTGPLLAVLDRTDRRHVECRDLLVAASEVLVLPSPVLVEIDYWIHTRLWPSIFIDLLDDINRGVFDIVELEPSDYQRVRDLCDQYADADIGFVDAAVLAIVERLREPKLATLDRRHFSVLRPRHISALTLLP